MPETIAIASRVAEKNDTSSAGAKVTVACKLPGGLELRVFKMVESSELVMGGGSRTTRVAQLAGRVFINGVAKKVEQSHGCMVVGGYALTPGVDKAFWDQWLEDNKDSLMVRNNLVFANESHAKLEGMAKERALVRSNLEPMAADPKTDPRAPRPVAGLTIEAGNKAA